jgi:hypothetical protein
MRAPPRQRGKLSHSRTTPGAAHGSEAARPHGRGILTRNDVVAFSNAGMHNQATIRLHMKGITMIHHPGTAEAA